jgi:hypothetical protein
MRKSITYSGFALASLVVILVFLTSKTYSQLLIAILLYPPLVYLAFKIFPKKEVTIEMPLPQQLAQKDEVSTVKAEREKVDVADIDKRAFLKMIGVAGVSFFLLSLFSRRGPKIPFLGKAVGGDTTQLEDATGNKIDPAQTQPTDGYRISEVDDNVITFYGFIKKGGAWFIMREDTDTGSFRYAKGEKEFSNNWGNREKLNYDYYSNIF